MCIISEILRGIYFFFSTRDLRAPSTDRCETLPHDRMYVQSYHPGPKNLLTPPPKKKNWGPESAKFGAISDNFRLQAQISLEGMESRIEKQMIDSNSSHVWQKKSHKLWYTNNKVGHVSLYPPKSAFSEDHISAPRGAAPSNFYMC